MDATTQTDASAPNGVGAADDTKITMTIAEAGRQINVPAHDGKPPADTHVTVLLPMALAGRAGSRTRLTISGGTVREVIAALDEAHPGMRFELCYETGELRPFVNVFVNGTHVRYLRGIETPLAPGATLHVLPSVAGG